MYESGTYNVGCGTFSYKISKPVTDLKEHDRFCYKPEDLPELKGDVQDREVMSGTVMPCASRALPQYIIKKDDKSTFVQNITTRGKVPYQYNIWWKEGCTLADNGPTAVFAADPLILGQDAGPTMCQDTLWKNWKECNNGGRGGNVQIGCLIYEFMASDVLREF